MAITTVDGVAAGLQPTIYFSKAGANMEGAGVLHSFAYGAGEPAASVAPSPGLAGAALTSYAGQLPTSNPVSGNSYIAYMEAACSTAGQLFVYDRLWHNSGIIVTLTTTQTVNSVAWPARDLDQSTDGRGIMVGIEVSTATTNGAAVTNTTMSYTNSTGTSGRTATMASFPQTAVLGSFVPFELAAGDVGVRSIQSVTLGTSYVTGAIHLVAYRLIASIPVVAASAVNIKDAVALGMPRVFDNSVLFLMYRASSTAGNVSGLVSMTHG